MEDVREERPRRSDSIAALAADFIKAQAAFKAPKKSETGRDGNREYKYTDLAAIYDAVRGPLKENNLCLLQPIYAQDGHLVVETILLHKSGEYISSDFPVKIFDEPKPQGSAITYTKRYAVMSLLCMAPEKEDDDGTAASKGRPQPQQAKEPPGEKIDLQARVLEAAKYLASVSGLEFPDILRRASARYPKGHTRQGVLMSLTERWEQPLDGELECRDNTSRMTVETLRTVFDRIQKATTHFGAAADEPPQEKEAQEGY